MVANIEHADLKVGAPQNAAPQPAEIPALEIEGGILGYGDSVAVAGPIHLSLEAGRVLAIVGRSGCGKTTLLKTIAGGLPLLAGTIRIQGNSRGRGWRARHVFRTLQRFPLLHWHTVAGNLRLAARIQKLENLDIERVLSDFSALHLKDKYPRELSGGERCRASLAQTAITNPVILLLDEPFTGLDLHTKKEIAERLFSFSRTRETSVIFVTHDVHDATAYSDTAAALFVPEGLPGRGREDAYSDTAARLFVPSSTQLQHIWHSAASAQAADEFKKLPEKLDKDEKISEEVFQSFRPVEKFSQRTRRASEEHAHRQRTQRALKEPERLRRRVGPRHGSKKRFC